MLIILEKRHKIKGFVWYYIIFTNINTFQQKNYALKRGYKFNLYVDILTKLDL